MLPFKSILIIKEDSRLPLYNKIANAIIEEISKGTLQPGTRIPSSRALAKILSVHRKTVVAAYDELIAQDWIETKGRKGTFIHQDLPRVANPRVTSYSHLDASKPTTELHPQLVRFDDGYPDIRLAPLKSLAREYSSLLKNRNFIHSLNYNSEFCGDIILREEICKYLFDTRGIYITPDHLLISRGSIMAFYLLINTHIQSGDLVISGKPGYQTFNEIILNSKGELLHVAVDQDGINVDEIEELCKRKKIKFIYVISHHHHPTTVTLSADRRIRLIELSKKYNFSIIEDDYDYDFHNESSPVLPLASLQHEGRVFYVGSFSKTIAPSLRLGFIVADPKSIQRLTKLRRLMDRTGDPVLERATAHLLKFGEVRRHLNKALKLYKKRRDVMCHLLAKNFSDYLKFQRPEGGMAIWVGFKKHINVNEIVDAGYRKGIRINHPDQYNSDRFIRIGFASVNEEEIIKGIGLLKETLGN